ncbi:MAG: ATP-binding protein [Gammaproteobacteria bacterium]|nr:ATP-binding protein [Gammaproteobacteria bacterium]
MLAEITAVLREHPDIKGREIAKKIGKAKKVVNSFLHAHSDNFIQDNNYCWSLTKAEVLKIQFQEDQWVDHNSFESSLRISGSPLDSECSSIHFVIPEKCKILLDASARFLALCNQLVHAGKDVTIDFNNCKSTLRFFDRIGFVEHLHENVTVLPKRPLVSRASIYKGNSEAVVEFGAVNPKQANKELINQLADCFVQQSEAYYETAASTVFGELIGNIQEHSESSILGFAALQKYEGRRKHIQTVISDSGLGIAATLKPSLKVHYPRLYELSNSDDFDIQLVTAVLTKGEISRFGSGRGLGFKSSREQAAKFDARLSIRQEKFSLELEYKNGEIVQIDKQENLPTIFGTHLCFDFFVD